MAEVDLTDHREPDRGEFQDWRSRWDELATFQGAHLPDPTGRTERILGLWRQHVPGNWQRGVDSQFLGGRYRRGDLGNPHSSEHTIGHEILVDGFTEAPCMGAQLIDGGRYRRSDGVPSFPVRAGTGTTGVLCYCGSLDDTLPTVTVVGLLPVFYEFLPVELR